MNNHRAMIAMAHENGHEVTIETLSTPPTHVSPAPLLRRVTAGIVDSFIVTILGLGLIGRLNELSSMLTIAGVASTPPTTLVYLGIVTLVYYFLLEWLFASTIGKSVLRLRVVGRDGDPCTLGASLKRGILRPIDWLPFFYVIGAIAILSSHDRQRIGDRIAATIVTKAPEKDINPPPAPFLFH
ncbi:MAG: RDD family protein [Candidatus Bathyarchaeia archaeon]